MPQTRHVETHFTSSDKIRDIVIGMSDGLTVPFALAAGLSGVMESTGIVITAGLAEVAAGAIAMGLGGYLAARTDAEHYVSEYGREKRETFDVPEIEMEEAASIFCSCGLPETTVTSVAQAIRSDRRRWIEFMMKFELGLDKPDPARDVVGPTGDTHNTSQQTLAAKKTLSLELQKRCERVDARRDRDPKTLVCAIRLFQRTLVPW